MGLRLSLWTANKKQSPGHVLHVTRGSDVTQAGKVESVSPHIGPRHLLLRPRSQMSQMSPGCRRARVLGSVTVNLSWSQPAEPPGLSAFSKQTSIAVDLIKMLGMKRKEKYKMLS